jgi:hypothetical protein
MRGVDRGTIESLLAVVVHIGRKGHKLALNFNSLDCAFEGNHSFLGLYLSPPMQLHKRRLLSVVLLNTSRHTRSFPPVALPLYHLSNLYSWAIAVRFFQAEVASLSCTIGGPRDRCQTCQSAARAATALSERPVTTAAHGQATIQPRR